jgi:hypothetical protein
MPDIHDVMDVTIKELPPEHQLQLKEAVDQFRQKCHMSFSKNRTGVPYLKSDMPRVLLPGEPDTTSAEEKQEVMNAVQQTMENIMAKHNIVVLNMSRQMMVSVFGPGMEKVLGRVSPKGLVVRQENQVLLSIANQLEMQVLSRLCKVREVNQSSRLCKVREVNQSSCLCKVREVIQSSSRTFITQCPIGLLMENWHSSLLEFHLALLPG